MVISKIKKKTTINIRFNDYIQIGQMEILD